MHRFFAPENLTPQSKITLSPEQSHHLGKVLRLESGQEVELTNGRGFLARAVIDDNSPKRAVLSVLEVSSEKSRSRLHLCFGFAKSQAFDFIVHRCTEIGVASFQPLLTQHALSPSSWNGPRWEKVIAEVAKQCQELHFPEIHEPVSLKDWLSRRDSGHTLVLCDEADRANTELKLSGEVDLLVGAEGGWSREEVDLIKGAGARSLGLGRNRLRAETASLAGALLVKHALGEI